MVGTDRRALIELLSRWERGELAPWQLVEEAEEAEEALFGERDLVPELDRADPQSIPIAVLELIATAPHQRLLPEDVPALVNFLKADSGSELEAWRRFDEYWESVDMAGRESRVTELYFGKQGHDGGAA